MCWVTEVTLEESGRRLFESLLERDSHTSSELELLQQPQPSSPIQPQPLAQFPQLETSTETQVQRNVMTIGVVHSVNFASRRASLKVFMASLPLGSRAFVACDVSSETSSDQGFRMVCDTTCRGINDCRNKIVNRANDNSSELVAIFDDDVIVPPGGLESLSNTLLSNANFDLLAGCYQYDCYAHRFVFRERSLSLDPVDFKQDSTVPIAAHLVQNAFLARTRSIGRSPFDERAHVMEHELNFLALNAIGLVVGFVPSVRFGHMPTPTTYDVPYAHSRHREADYLQWTCKNFPKIQRFVTDSYNLDCVRRTASLPYQDVVNKPISWSYDEHAYHRAPYPDTDVLFIVPVVYNDSRLRSSIRASWISWLPPPDQADYLFVTNSPLREEPKIVGDVLSVSVSRDTYSALGTKLITAMKWISTAMTFSFLVKVDTDTIVYPRRLVSVLMSGACSSGYCGRVRYKEAPIREERHPWHVELNQWAFNTYPPYCAGGSYAISNAALEKVITNGASALLPHLEDVSLGIAAKLSEVRPTNIEGFLELPVDHLQRNQTLLQKECCGPRVLAYHKPISPEVCEMCTKDGALEPYVDKRPSRRTDELMSPPPPPPPPPLISPAPVLTWPPPAPYSACTCNYEDPPAHEFNNFYELKNAVKMHSQNPSLASETYGDISAWNVAKVDNMNHLFYGYIDFNSDITSWDTSQVTDMAFMFAHASKFNQPLEWDTSRVTSMRMMFYLATAFNQPLDWDTSQVTDMAGMFLESYSLNQELDMSNVEIDDVDSVEWPQRIGMFRGASVFNQPLHFDTSKVTDFGFFFTDAVAFNQPLQFDTSSATSMHFMFANATAFNQPIDYFDTSSATGMHKMFANATAFNQPLNSWDVSGATVMYNMFQNATSFNQPLNSWDVASATNMESMFHNASAFNQPLDSWDFTKSTARLVMKQMFKRATSFNQPLDSWDLSTRDTVDYFEFLDGATSFDSSLPIFPPN